MSSTKIHGLYPIIDTTYVARDKLKETALKIMDGGARVVQLRAKGLNSADMLRSARIIKPLAMARNVTFIINDHVDIAVMSNADGVHLGTSDTDIKEARDMLGYRGIIGLSTHNPDEARRGAEAGADYISFGPIFPTSTKKDADTPKGIEALGELVSSVDIPVVAIGGITCERLEEVLATGVEAVAMISDIILADDLSAKVASIIKKIERFKAGG